MYTHSIDLSIRDRVRVYTRYGTLVSEGWVTQIDLDLDVSFVWVDGEVFSAEAHLFVLV